MLSASSSRRFRPKNISLHAHALLLHRTLEILIRYYQSVSGKLFDIILSQMDIRLPLNLLPWRAIVYYLQREFIVMAYALNAHIVIQN